jgi:hypothetical protein
MSSKPSRSVEVDLFLREQVRVERSLEELFEVIREFITAKKTKQITMI